MSSTSPAENLAQADVPSADQVRRRRLVAAGAQDLDEAHSSQTGDSATALKAVLGNKAPEPNPDEPPDPAEDALAAAVAARGKQANLSFFAFSATPKARTLEIADPSAGLLPETMALYDSLRLRRPKRQAIST